MNIYTIIAARFFVCKESLTHAAARPTFSTFPAYFSGPTERRSEKQQTCKSSRFLRQEKRGGIEPRRSLVARELRLNRRNKLATINIENLGILCRRKLS